MCSLPIRIEQCAVVAIVSAACWYLAVNVNTLKKFLGNDEGATRQLKENFETVAISLACRDREIQITTDRRCAKRFAYLRDVTRHECFQRYGVPEDADDCTLIRYLIYTERICPEDFGSVAMRDDDLKSKMDLIKSGILPEAKPTLQENGIVSILSQCGEVCDWIRYRITETKPSWINATTAFFSKKSIIQVYPKRRKLTVLLHMGLLTKEFGLDFGRGAFVGGPLGELVQWADLIAGLHFLGHEVVLSWSRERLKKVLLGEVLSSNICKRAVIADLVYTDITGLLQMRNVLGTIHHYRCRLRVLDVYGTEPEFNHPRYQQWNSAGNGWGGIGLNPKQFLTHFPHTPDNSFLGFAVARATQKIKVRSDRCLLYGKRLKYLKALAGTKLLETLHRHFPNVHATIVANEPNEAFKLPPYVTNHGAIDQRSYIELLGSSKLLVGLGQPVEGPAPLEAIANGAVFLNPKFAPGFQTHKGKPTNRSLTTQHPYLEESIGEPYTFTVDLRDDASLENILRKIRTSQLNAAKITYEFTHLGFLERLNAYIENQDFCEETFNHDPSSGVIWKRDKSTWPPLSSLVTKHSNSGESCVEACIRYNMTCERQFFPFINQENAFIENGLVCSSYTKLEYFHERKQRKQITDICHAPSIDLVSASCTMQSDSLLFSCACASNPSIRRLCPCREYKEEQISLCRDCE